MPTFMRIFGSIAVLLLVSACGSTIETVRSMPATGSAFQNAAHSEYIAQAQLEIDESDWPNASLYIDKAEQSALGVTVQPDTFENRNIPVEAQADLSKARGELMAALDGGARESQPAKAAHCQAIFDCWMEEQHEGHQAKDIKFCRDAYETCYAELAPAPAPAPAPMPKPAVQKVSGPFFIYFDFDSSALDGEAMKAVEAVAAEHAKNSSSKYLVRAYTDTSGSSAYNIALSGRRAAAVRDALGAKGIADSNVTDEALGESELEVQTGDGVMERRNRRAVIYLVK